MHRYQVPEENHQYCNQWDLAVFLSVGCVSSAGLGQLWARAVWTSLLNRLDWIWRIPESLHLHHGSVCTLHIPPLSGHPLQLFWYCLEATQGVPIHPEQWYSIRECRKESYSCKYKMSNNVYTLHVFDIIYIWFYEQSLLWKWNIFWNSSHLHKSLYTNVLKLTSSILRKHFSLQFDWLEHSTQQDKFMLPTIL